MSEPKADIRPLRPEPLITGHDALPAGSRYRRPQGLDFHLIVLTLSGEAWIGREADKVLQRPGDVVLVEPRAGVDQDVSSRRGWRRLWAIFDPRPHWHDWLGWPEASPGLRRIHLQRSRPGTPVRDHLEAMHRHATGTMRRRGELALASLEAALLWCDAANPRSEQARLDPRVALAMDFVARRLAEPMSLDRLAEVAGLSVPHLVKRFREQIDQSPMQFVERRRMRRAAELLQMTSQTVAEVAAAVGYDDPFYFSTRFKRYAGRSPRAYRREL